VSKQFRRQMTLFPSNAPYFERIQQLARAAATGTVTVSLGSVRDTAKPPAAKVRHQRILFDEATAEILRGIVTATLIELQERLQEGLVVRPYAGGAKLADDEIEHLDLAAEQRIVAQMQQLASPLSLDTFSSARKDFMTGLRYYVISVQPESGSMLHCFRSYSETFELQRSRWTALLNLRGDGYYDAVRTPGLLFDHDRDCVCSDGDKFILNKAKFQQIFRFYEYVQLDASKAIQTLNQKVPLANMEEVIAASKRDSRMAIRLADLPGQPHFKRLSISRMKRMIAYRGLPIRTEVRGDVEMLVYSKEYKAEFLRLLCDDYVTSHMTRLDYESTVKRALKPGRQNRATSTRLRAVS
jgi:Kiwa protein KwaB-like